VAGATYRVYRNTANKSSTATFLSSVVTTSYSDSSGSLNGARTYYYWVSAVIEDLESSLSVVETGKKAISPLTNLTASNASTNMGVILSWMTHLDATGYDIYRSTTNNFADASQVDFSASGTFLDDTSIGGIDYFYWVVATNSFGASEPSASVVGQRRAYAFQPDLRVGKSPGAILGDNVYGQQSAKFTQKRRKKVRGFFSQQNDGETTDTSRISASKGSRYFSMSYRLVDPISANITAAVRVGDYITSAMLPGESELTEISAKPRKSIRRTTRTRSYRVLISAVSMNDPTKSDQFSVKAISRK